MSSTDIKKERKVKRILPTSILIICIVLTGCRNSPKIVRVELIDRNAFSKLNENPDPLLLVVGIEENGRLSLNKIETGELSDPTILNGKLQIIFDDREKAGISEREVIIDPQGNVKNEDLEKLIESMTGAKAEPIRIIKTNL